MTAMTKTATVKTPPRRATSGVGRLVRRLDRERRQWTRTSRTADGAGPVVPTEQAWRAGVAEGLRLAQVAIRRGV